MMAADHISPTPTSAWIGMIQLWADNKVSYAIILSFMPLDTSHVQRLKITKRFSLPTLGWGEDNDSHLLNRPSTTLLDWYWLVASIIRCSHRLCRRFVPVDISYVHCAIITNCHNILTGRSVPRRNNNVHRRYNNINIIREGGGCSLLGLSFWVLSVTWQTAIFVCFGHVLKKTAAVDMSNNDKVEMKWVSRTAMVTHQIMLWFVSPTQSSGGNEKAAEVVPNDFLRLSGPIQDIWCKRCIGTIMQSCYCVINICPSLSSWYLCIVF